MNTKITLYNKPHTRDFLGRENLRRWLPLLGQQGTKQKAELYRISLAMGRRDYQGGLGYLAKS